MRILFVASELAPWAKVGGLGDVVGSLPKALAKLGVEVSIAIPYYDVIREKRVAAKKIGEFPVRLAQETQKAVIYQAKLPKSSVSVFLLDNKKYLSRGKIYFERTAFAGSFKEIRRFLFFSKAVNGFLLNGKFRADIVHANDWHTGALASLIKNGGLKMKNVRTVFTIHNLANQGIWNAKDVVKWFGKHNFRFRGKNFNFMAEGIINADVVTAVSPTYAKEILTKQYGAGLEKLLASQARQRKLVGILNGINRSDWPPEKRNKPRFQKLLGLEINSRSPIFGLVARLTYQKGINLIAPLVPYFVKKYNAQFVFLGQGETQNEKILQALAKKYPKNVYTQIGFDAELARHIYAQSDFFLMPSLFEPSGLGQMISMRYGAVPIARRTGGLKDTVIHKKTGFVFNKPKPEAFRRAVEEALAAYNRPAQFKKITRNCRRQDFSWKKSARKYLEWYRKISKNQSSTH